MGDYSPWQTIDQGRRCRPAVSLVLVWSILGHPLPAGLPETRGLRGPIPPDDTPRIGAPQSSPRPHLGEPTVVSSSRPTALNALRVLHQRVTASHLDGRRGRVGLAIWLKQAAATTRDDRHNRRDPGSGTRKVHRTGRAATGSRRTAAPGVSRPPSPIIGAAPGTARRVADSVDRRAEPMTGVTASRRADRGVSRRSWPGSAARARRSRPTCWSATSCASSRPTSGRRGSRRWTRSSAGSTRPGATACASPPGPTAARCSASTRPAARPSGDRPYRTVVSGVDPIDGRCDCPDFVKNSLGVCKHVLVVLELLYARPRLLQRARAEQEQAGPAPPAGLRWDPIRPLTGPGDWLDRVTWLGPFGAEGGRRRGPRPGSGAAKDDGPGPQGDVHRRPGEAPGPGRRPARARRPGARGLAHDPALHRPADRRARPARAGRQAGADARRAAVGVQGAEADALPLPARGGRAVPGRRPAAPGRRHGPGQDRAGDRLGRHPLADRAGPPRPDHRPGQPQAAVGPRVGGVLRPPRPRSSTAPRPSARRSTSRTSRACSSSTTSN